MPARSFRALAAACVLAFVLLVPASSLAAPSADYVVVLKQGVSVSAHLKAQKLSAQKVYGFATNGYLATLNDAQYAKLLASGDVVAIAPDEQVVAGKPSSVVPPPATQPAQAPSSAVKRVGLLSSSTAAVNGVDSAPDVDVAVLDTGIDSNHPDLRVAAAANCTSAKSGQDDNGHGTMVAGFAAAIDNAIGRVGTAPGARIWSVKVLNRSGNGTLSDVLCGIDWVTSNASDIDVANMSLVFSKPDTANCGDAAKKNAVDVLHRAICNSIAAGVTYVVAAGNSSEDAARYVPAAYDEVVTVSAFADNDGQAGGLGPAFNCLPTEVDDRFATFSNFGLDVDISAPGVCINSTNPDDNYGTGSGTSFASPLVAGAAALYISTHQYASPAGVRAALIAASTAGTVSGDPDGTPEGALNVASF